MICECMRLFFVLAGNHDYTHPMYQVRFYKQCGELIITITKFVGLREEYEMVNHLRGQALFVIKLCFLQICRPPRAIFSSILGSCTLYVNASSFPWLSNPVWTFVSCYFPYPILRHSAVLLFHPCSRLVIYSFISSTLHDLLIFALLLGVFLIFFEVFTFPLFLVVVSFYICRILFFLCVVKCTNRVGAARVRETHILTREHSALWATPCKRI